MKFLVHFQRPSRGLGGKLLFSLPAFELTDDDTLVIENVFGFVGVLGRNAVAVLLDAVIVIPAVHRALLGLCAGVQRHEEAKNDRKK